MMKKLFSFTEKVKTPAAVDIEKLHHIKDLMIDSIPATKIDEKILRRIFSTAFHQHTSFKS